MRYPRALYGIYKNCCYTNYSNHNYDFLNSFHFPLTLILTNPKIYNLIFKQPWQVFVKPLILIYNHYVRSILYCNTSPDVNIWRNHIFYAMNMNGIWQSLLLIPMNNFIYRPIQIIFIPYREILFI